MSYLVILRGPAGVGKTTVGEKLAEVLNGECIHIDKILDDNGLGYISGEKWVPEINFLKVNEILEPHINEQLNKGMVVVVEGNFYHKSQIEDILRKVRHKYYSFTLKAGLETCINRDKNRSGIGKERVKAVFKLVSTFDYGIVIDTEDKMPEHVVKEIISHLPNSNTKKTFEEIRLTKIQK
ncbi:Shikimate kinase [uncultured archaeon]|nr:Shikimate kinase [uncultured archaeon]